jgi:nitrite reductase/ring-hydroxylating ferredoxin subunit
MEETVWVAHVSKLVENVPFSAQVEGVELIVLKCRGSVAVFQGVCPHQGTFVAGGVVEVRCCMQRARLALDCLSGKVDGPGPSFTASPPSLMEPCGVPKAEVRA